MTAAPDRGTPEGESPPAATVRPAGADDVVGVLGIDHDHERAGEIAEAVLGGRCIVAEIDGAIAGFCTGGTFFGFDFLELLIVRDDVRRRGIGTALVEAWAAGGATARRYTSTNESNAPMRALCRRLGFTEAGRIDLDEGDPEIVYVRRVPPASRRAGQPGATSGAPMR